MVETKVNLDNVLALLNLAENTSETVENEPESSQNTRSRTTANKLVDGLAAFKRFFESNKDEPESVPRVINCLVKVMSGMFKSISEQGRQIKNIMEELKSEKNRREELLVEIASKYEEMERKDRDNMQEIIKAECEKTEKVLEKKVSEEIERTNINIVKKVDNLEKEIDEGRQRELKGTLIISSPERGHIQTEAVARRQEWEDSAGMESELDMVLRMIYDKTGVWIPYEDVSACHRFGKEESHSYVLKVWNWKKYSAWDKLSWGMLTGKGFSNNKNIFINFMLTARRTELSKQVRQAKKDKEIAKYSIDQNGKIYIKQIGGDNRYRLVTTVDDLNRLKKSS